MTGRPGYQPKTRNAHFRKRKRIILLATEGANRTESLYFKSISWPDCVIRFAHGNYTDPVNMVTALKKEYDELELDVKLGDAAFCLVDSDVDPKKDLKLEKADSEVGGNIELIVSSPCFEIWFLCHFSASTRQYYSSDEVLKALKRHIPNYRKEMNGIWGILGDKTDIAIRNAIILEQECMNKGLKRHTVAFSPSTEVYKIIKVLDSKE